MKVNGTTRFSGLYKNDQGIPQVPKGASYAKSVYIAHKNSAGDYIMGNITMAGSALGAWIEFGQRHHVQSGKVIMKKGIIQESPVGNFYPPEFEWFDTSDEEEKIAVALDKDLQIYLSQYLSQPRVAEDTISNDVPATTTTDDRMASRSGGNQLPPVETDKRADKQEDDAIRDLMQNPPYQDEQIDPSEIPF